MLLEVHKTEKRIVFVTFLHVSTHNFNFLTYYMHLSGIVLIDDDNRVILTPLEDLTDDYMNASYMNVSIYIVLSCSKKEFLFPYRAIQNRKGLLQHKVKQTGLTT